LFHSSVSAKQEDSMEAAAVTPPRDPPWMGSTTAFGDVVRKP
jgi:hypothetical protein